MKSDLLSAKTYIGNFIENSKNMLGMKYTSYNNPFDRNYHPKQDTSSLCTPQEQAYYCSLIGSANWCVTLGRYNIAYATSTLAQYSIALRTGHLQAVFRLMGYLKQYPNAAIPVDRSFLPLSTTDEFEL